MAGDEPRRAPRPCLPLLLGACALALVTLAALAPPAGASTATVDTEGDGNPACTTQTCYFSPAHLGNGSSIKVGATVTFANPSQTYHSAKTTSGPDSFDTNTLNPGGSADVVLRKAGDYAYECGVHTSSMGTGSIHVAAASVSVAITSPANNAFVGTSFTVHGTAKADNQLQKVEINLNSTGWIQVGLNNDGTWASGTISGHHGDKDTIQARATDIYDETSSVASVTVTVDAPPAPAFSYAPTSPTTSDTITLNSSSTDPDGDAVTVSWHFDDGTPDGLGNPTTHQFLTHTAHNVTLVATDSLGATANLTKKITVANSPPVANFTLSDETPGFNETITFTSISTDIDGTIASTSWDFGDGAGATGGTATHAYAAAGNYTVRLNVTDDSGAAASLARVLEVLSIIGKKPIANLTASPLNGTAPLTVSFHVDGYSPTPGGSLVNWTLDFGDGDATQGAGGLLGNGGLSVDHRYMRGGDFDAALRVLDNNGNLASNHTIIHAVAPPNRPPAAAFVVTPATANKGDPVRFTDMSTDPDAGDAPAQWEWNFGDGSPPFCCDKRAVDHVYLRAGQFLAFVTVADTRGLAGTSPAQTVTIEGRPPGVLMVANATSGRAPLPVSFTLTARDSDGTVQRWSLDFGDGTAPASGEGGLPNGTLVRHVYDEPGSFAAVFTAVDDDNLQGRAVQLLDVGARAAEPFPLPPGAIDAVPSQDQRLTVTFTAATGLQGDLTYQWRFGDGHNATGQGVVYTYASPGTYNVSLLVESAGGPLATATAQVQVVEELGAANPVRTEVANGVIRVSWTADPRAAGYQVWRSVDGGPYALAADVTGATSFADLDVQDAHQYAYRVTFYSMGGDGKLESLAQLNRANAFRLLGTAQAEAYVDSDHDGTRDSLENQGAGAFLRSPLALPLLALALIALAALAWWKRGAIRARLRPGTGPRPLTDLPGLTPGHARILQAAGVADTHALVAADAQALGRATVIPARQLEVWQAMARMLQVRGVTPPHAQMLVRLGITQPTQLAQADPVRLARSVAPPLPEREVASWVRDARRRAWE